MPEKQEEKIPEVEDKAVKAKELYALGCRNYYVKNYIEAADQLSDATELYSELYGVDGEELGEIYLLYAKALIAVAQEENKLVDIQEEEDDDEEGEDAENDKPMDVDENSEAAEEKSTDLVNGDKKAPKDLENVEKKDPESGEMEEQKDAESGEKEVSKDPENDKKDEKSEADSTVADDKPKDPAETVLTNGNTTDDAKEDQQAGPSDEKNADDTDADEEGGNLEVAWEVLQNAAQIFQRQEEKGLANLLDVYNEMAGISIENGNFSVALEDYARALTTFDKIEESQRNYRVAAEIHYRVGLCQTLEKCFDESIKAYQKAHDLMAEVIEKEKSKEQTDEVAANIKDMEETKQEILNKINETGEIKTEEFDKVKKELAKFYSKMNGTAESPKDQSTSSATDISHLIKRKKPDVDSNLESSPAKKQVIETEEVIKAVPAEDEKKKIEEEESVQPAIEN